MNRSSRGPSSRVLSWVLAAAFGLAMNVWSQLQTTTLRYELSAGERVSDRLATERATLEVELATLTSPEGLDSLARRDLRLRPPAEGQVVGVSW